MLSPLGYILGGDAFELLERGVVVVAVDVPELHLSCGLLRQHDDHGHALVGEEVVLLDLLEDGIRDLPSSHIALLEEFVLFEFEA